MSSKSLNIIHFIYVYSKYVHISSNGECWNAGKDIRRVEHELIIGNRRRSSA